MSIVGDQYTVDVYPSVGAALTGLTLQSVTLPTSPTMKAMSITKKVDSASPKLFAACAVGKHIPKIIITMRKSGGDATTGTNYLMTMNNCVVTGVSHNSNGTDTISLSYSQSTSNFPASAGILSASRV